MKETKYTIKEILYILKEMNRMFLEKVDQLPGEEKDKVAIIDKLSSSNKRIFKDLFSKLNK